MKLSSAISSKTPHSFLDIENGSAKLGKLPSSITKPILIFCDTLSILFTLRSIHVVSKLFILVEYAISPLNNFSLSESLKKNQFGLSQ